MSKKKKYKHKNIKLTYKMSIEMLKDTRYQLCTFYSNNNN